MNILLILNVVFVVLCWKWAHENFEKGLNYMGWIYIVASSWNAAAFMATVL